MTQLNITSADDWLSRHPSRHYILAYGSLLNRDSRERHSNMFADGVMAKVKGFERGWYTRAFHENQTYVGATPSQGKMLNAQLLPVELNPSFQQREQDYRFVEVSVDNIEFDAAFEQDAKFIDALEQAHVWICETLQIIPADEAHPVSQTYIDTCIAGCLTQGGETEARLFVDTTSHWHHPRRFDRVSPCYPRYGRVDDEQLSSIDKLLVGI